MNLARFIRPSSQGPDSSYFWRSFRESRHLQFVGVVVAAARPPRRPGRSGSDHRSALRRTRKSCRFDQRRIIGNLEDYLHAYIDGCDLAGDPKGLLFRTIARGNGGLTSTPLPQANAYAMIRRRAAAAGIETKIGNHTFRATGITAYLKNGGALETAAAMANHSSTRTTQLYDRRSDQVSLDEIERVRI